MILRSVFIIKFACQNLHIALYLVSDSEFPDALMLIMSHFYDVRYEWVKVNTVREAYTCII